MDKCVDMDVETRQHISRLVMGLCLKELFEFRYMQTDPNWSNFLYNPETRQVKLSINLGIKEFFVKKVGQLDQRQELHLRRQHGQSLALI